MRILSWISVACVLAVTTAAFGTQKSDTSHLAFVTEFVRELSAIEDIQSSNQQEVEQGTTQEKLMGTIHACSLLQFELQSEIGVLKQMRLNTPPYDQVIPTLIHLYEMKVGYFQRISDISSVFLAAPKPNVDYGKMAAQLPKIRAELENIDQTLFNPMSPLIFSTLIDLKPDSENHASHLIITKAERAKLIDELNGRFGSKLDAKDQNARVSAAKVLKGFLIDHKCSDDPW